MVECTKCSRKLDAEDFDKHVREVHSVPEKAKGDQSSTTTCSFCARVLSKEEYLTHFKVGIQTPIFMEAFVYLKGCMTPKKLSFPPSFLNTKKPQARNSKFHTHHHYFIYALRYGPSYV